MTHAYAIVLLVLTVTLISVDAQDVSVLLQNRALVEQQLSCVLRRSPCDFIGRMLTRFMPDILSGCGRCPPEQAANARTLVNFIRANYPNEYAQIVQLYGTQG